MLAFVPQRSTWSGAGKRTNLNKDIKDIPHDSGGSTRPHFSVNKSKLSWTFFFPVKRRLRQCVSRQLQFSPGDKFTAVAASQNSWTLKVDGNNAQPIQTLPFIHLSAATG